MAGLPHNFFTSENQYFKMCSFHWHQLLFASISFTLRGGMVACTTSLDIQLFINMFWICLKWRKELYFFDLWKCWNTIRHKCHEAVPKLCWHQNVRAQAQIPINLITKNGSNLQFCKFLILICQDVWLCQEQCWGF